MTERGRRLFAVLSPILLIAVGRVVQQVVGRVLGVWAWVPTMLFYWASIAGVIVWVGGVASIARWLRPARGPWAWRLLAVTVGLLSLPGFVKHSDVVRPPAMLFLSLTFAVVNPWFEEGYWRGVLLDTTARWGGLLSVSYSAIGFAVSHPLIWGVHSVALRQWAILPVLAAVGAAWAVAYRRSGSLRWPVAGHMCADLFGLSVPVLLNLHVPSGT
jgi:CAAX protease family protein